MRKLAFVLLCMLSSQCLGQELVKVAIGQGGNSLEALVTEIGQAGGVFGRHNLKLEIIYTAGAGETLQATISRSVDFGISIGTSGALSAGEKGAPIRVIGSTSVGSPVFWYVKGDSPIRDMSDIGGHTIGYSTRGSGTYAVAELARARVPTAKLVATGTIGATFTQVMTQQLDVGFATAEFAQKYLDDGSIRLISRDNDFDRIRRQSIRVFTAHVSVPEDRYRRFRAAYKETVDWIFSGDPAPIRMYAEAIKVSEARAKELADSFASKEMLDPSKVRGISLAIEDALAAKMIQSAPSEAQLSVLIIPEARE